MGGGRGGHPPPKKVHKKKCSPKISPKAAREGNHLPPNMVTTKFFSPKISRRGHCGRRPPGGAKGGKERGEVFATFKKTGREAPHSNLVNNNSTVLIKINIITNNIRSIILYHAIFAKVKHLLNYAEDLNLY